ncbi:helix-turn-helix domain-containing protein [Microbacterium sp. 22303]|uniref:helix-turn-helix domain-containing protein n=1 Tax=Microbacterium sp. 22303 TaxID=3453905 RepID=UPI003F82CDC9
MATETRTRQRGNPAGPTATIVGENVRRVRTVLQLTQAQLSQRLDALEHPIPVASVGRLESGDRRVEVDDLMALSVALGVSPLGLLMPYTRGPEDEIEMTGFGRMSADDAWGWVLADHDASKQAEDEPGSMYARSFPKWVETRVPRR